LEHDLNTCVYVHQRFSLLMGKRGAMVEMIRTRWAAHLELRYGVRLAGVWATAGSTGEWPEMHVQWEFDDWDHFGRASAAQHPMEERDTYLTELWNQALDFRRGGHSMLLRPAPWCPDVATIRSEGLGGDVILYQAVRSRPGCMAAYHDALASRYISSAEAHGLRLLGAYEHVIVPNTGMNLWALPGWDEWKRLLAGGDASPMRAWSAGVEEWLADLDSFVIVPPPAEALRT
jgi:hypothetical protein